MPFDLTSIQADEQGLRIMQVPEGQLSPDAIPAKVRVTDGGEAQQANPSLRSVGNLDWHMAKSYVKLALSLLDLENPNHEPAGSAEGGQFAEGQGTGQKKLTIRTNQEQAPQEQQKVPPKKGAPSNKHGYSVDQWYDRSARSYITEIVDPYGNPIGNMSEYSGNRADAKWAKAKWGTDHLQRIERYIDSGGDPEEIGRRYGEYERYNGSLNKVPSAAESGILRKVIKGERSANGYRSYWLLENGEVKTSIVALTDQEADELLNDNR